MSGILNIRDPNTGKFTPVTAIAGVGVPAKGTTGQILTKISDADYDTQWKENDASKLGGKTPEEYATAESVNQLKNDKANKSTIVSATLSTANWTGDSAPYSYTLSVDGVTATSNQEILPALDVMSEQIEALQAANIVDAGQEDGVIILRAFGDKPSIDLPIRVIRRGD